MAKSRTITSILFKVLNNKHMLLLSSKESNKMICKGWQTFLKIEVKKYSQTLTFKERSRDGDNDAQTQNFRPLCLHLAFSNFINNVISRSFK